MFKYSELNLCISCCFCLNIYSTIRDATHTYSFSLTVVQCSTLLNRYHFYPLCFLLCIITILQATLNNDYHLFLFIFCLVCCVNVCVWILSDTSPSFFYSWIKLFFIFCCRLLQYFTFNAVDIASPSFNGNTTKIEWVFELNGSVLVSSETALQAWQCNGGANVKKIFFHSSSYYCYYGHDCYNVLYWTEYLNRMKKKKK